MNKMIYGLVFACGVLTGAVIDYHFLKSRFEERLDREIDQMKKQRKKEQTAENDNDESEKIAVNGEHAVTSGRYPWNEKGTTGTSSDGPYFISPADYDELDGYSSFRLVMYSDGTLADENDDQIDHPEELLGASNLDAIMSEYGYDETIYIRNDEKKSDYEVTKDIQSFYEYIEGNPYLQKTMEGFDG